MYRNSKSTLANTLKFKCHNKRFSLIICIRWNYKKGADAIVNKNKKEMKSDKFEFNTYFIFSEEKQDINQTIGLIFKDYLENLKIKK